MLPNLFIRILTYPLLNKMVSVDFLITENVVFFLMKHVLLLNRNVV